MCPGASRVIASSRRRPCARRRALPLVRARGRSGRGARQRGSGRRGRRPRPDPVAPEAARRRARRVPRLPRHAGNRVARWQAVIGTLRLHCPRRPLVVDGLWRSLVSALVWGTKGPGFKSRQPDQRTAGDGPGVRGLHLMSRCQAGQMYVARQRQRVVGNKPCAVRGTGSSTGINAQPLCRRRLANQIPVTTAIQPAHLSMKGGRGARGTAGAGGSWRADLGTGGTKSADSPPASAPA